MAVKLDVIPLAGGLDEASGKTTPIAGRLLGVENFEVVFGSPGYRRIAGYERLDGRTAPSAGTYHNLPFSTGTAAIAVGNTVTSPSGSGYVLRVVVSTGSWGGGDAAGYLIITALTGSINNGETLSVSASPKAVAANDTSPASTSDVDYATDIVLTRDYYRNQITKPTGYGAILGVAVFRDTVYCLRNADSGGLTATLWKSSASGWTAVRTGLRGGGTLRTASGSFTGTGGDLALYGVDGKNRCWSYTGSVFTFAPAIYGSEGSSSTSVTPGTGAKVFTVAESSRDWVAGDALTIYSAADASKYMIGTVTTWAAPTLTVSVTSAAGTAATDWHIARTDGINRPKAVAIHKSHLFLGYPLGQLQHSDLGAPFTFGLTSGAIGVGDEIVDLVTLRSDVLAIFQTDRVALLYGSGSADWQLKQHSRSSNTRIASAQEVGGNAMFINDSGVMSLVGSDAFGDFDAANIAGAALKTLRNVMTDYKTTTLIKTDSQYRIYGAGKQVFCMSWVGSSPVPQSSAFTRLRYLHQPVCAFAGESGGEELVVFGTDDGWVMRERSGTTFDGTAIHAFIRTSYWHSGSPDAKKRYRKLTLDCDATEAVTIYFKLDYDFGGPDAVESIQFSAEPSGGYYDLDNWDEFYWSNPESAQLETSIEGVGKFLSLLLWSESDAGSFNVYGMTLQYSPLELKR